MPVPSDLPSFIPQDLLDAYGEDARRDVRRARPSGVTGVTTLAVASQSAALTDPTAPSAVVRPPERPLLATAALLGLAGSVILTGLWSWLAVSLGNGIWWWLAVSGLALIGVTSLLVARLLVAPAR